MQDHCVYAMYILTDSVLEWNVGYMLWAHCHLQIILKRAQSLRSANPILEEESQPLNILAISHPLDELRRIRIRLLQNLLRTSRRRNI